MKSNNFNHHQVLSEEKETFLKFMNQKYPIFYNSNIFFRDIQFAITTFFTMKGKPINYSRAEQLTYNFIKQLEETDELQNVSKNTWRVNFHLEKKTEEENKEAEVEDIKQEG